MEPVWNAIIKKENLQPIPYKQIVSWGFGDFAFNQDFDNEHDQGAISRLSRLYRYRIHALSVLRETPRDEVTASRDARSLTKDFANDKATIVRMCYI